MSKKYTLQDAARYLGVSQGVVEDLVSDNSVSYTMENNVCYIDENSLRKIKTDRIREGLAGAYPSDSLLNDRDFIEFFSDYIHVRFSELIKTLDDRNRADQNQRERTNSEIKMSLDELRGTLISLADMELSGEAAFRLERIMMAAVEKTLPSGGFQPGSEGASPKALTASDLKAISNSIASVLDEKLSRFNTISDKLTALEDVTVKKQDKILKTLEEIKTKDPLAEVKPRFEAFITYISDSLDKKLAALVKDKNEINALLKNVGDSKSAITTPGAAPDLSAITAVLEDMQEGQKKARKIMIDLNVNLQKSIFAKLDELKGSFTELPEYIDTIKQVVPTLKEDIGKKLEEISQINKAITSLQSQFSVEGQQQLLEKIGSLKDNLGKVDAGGAISGMDEKFSELKNALEQSYLKLASRQQKVISDRLEKLKFPQESIDAIVERLQTIENTFPELSDFLEERFGKVNDALKQVDGLQAKVQKSEGTAGGQDVSALENKISRLQSLMDAFLEKFDMNSMVSSFQETLEETLDTFKESQDSFQKTMVNLNVNNQRTMADKLEQLDRLNELIPMKDTVDEIAEQMDTFEAMMADINQLVDERLQLLQEIQSGLGSVGGSLPQGMGGDVQTRILKKMDEIGSVVGMLKDKGTPDGIINQMKTLIEKMGDDLKQNQEAAQKILVNLNVNSQKWSLERLDEINANFDTVREIKEQFGLLENLIPSISEFMELKLRDLGEVTASLQKLETGKLLGDNLHRVQKVVENETKALRQSIEASQKIMTTLANNNQKLLMEKLNSAGLSGKAIDDIARKNQDVLSAIIGQMEPGKNLSGTIENLVVALEEIKNSMGVGFAIDKLEDFLTEQAERSRKSQDSVTRILTGLYETNHSLSMSKIDQLVSSLADLKATLNPEAMAHSFGELVMEGNEILKQNQGALMNLQMNHYKEIMEELKRIQTLKGSVAGASSAGELVPVIESLMNNSISNFKQDLDGAHKVLVNLNINLQKQMITKIQEILSQKDRNLEVKIDTDSLVNTMEYLLDEKLGEIKESQESLLSVNLSSQKTLIEKLDRLSKMPKGSSGESIADDLNSLLPLIERIIADKLKEIVASHQKAQTSLDNLTRDVSTRINQKLDTVIEEVKKSSALNEVDNYLPAIREALEDTFSYMSQLKGDIESLKDNIKLQDPEFFGKKFEEIKKFLASPGEILESIPKLEQLLIKNVKDQKEAMDAIGGKLEYLYNAIKSVSDEKGDSGSTMRIQQLFSKKLEETRELERQLVRSFQEMQEVFSQGYQGSNDEGIQAILQNLEETRTDQEKLTMRIEQLSTAIRHVSAGKGEAPPVPAAEAAAVEQMKNENSRLRQAVEKLRRENMDLGNQLKTALTAPAGKGGMETRRLDQLQAVMLEKDRLLEECYRDKVDLRDQLEKERRDKYEIIQKYETEKKELIDSLALERIQREKDRAELELLRAESRKKKWW
ncbi:MAG: hypothetical protein LWY06_00160 [Firmicutes bacterium]|nr:hypothetical protein [Bacillota bacterium]